jgi:antitoxin HicB
MMQAGSRIEQMTHYIALIHKDADSCYGVSFPDVPGAFTVGDTIDEAIENAGEVLGFAAEDWSDLNGDKFPRPRTIDELRADPTFRTLHRMRSLQRCLCGNPYWRSGLKRQASESSASPLYSAHPSTTERR